MDEYTVKGAQDFIENLFLSPYYDREDPNRPLLLKVSLLQPHYPYSADRDTFNYYLNRVSPFLDQEVSTHPFLSGHQVRPGIDATERDLRRATAAYYAMVETIDGHFGRVLHALEAAGQDLDDWIIVYTSDHGEMLGEHGVWEKQKFYEGSVRVPLFIRWPNRFPEPRQVSQNVSHCDLFATLCNLAGLPVPAGLDSRDLIPLMNGDDAEWDNEAVSQFGKHNLMIKQDHWKYQYYGPEMPEVLFDLDRDPAERVNFADILESREVLSMFRTRLAELGHGPQANENYRSAGYPRRSMP
jgi:choline-sulfatase